MQLVGCLEMSFWVYCNSCFLSAGADRQLAVTTCGHVICSVCYQKGKQGNCAICSSQCQISPLSDKSSSEVKALFSDINAVTTKHLTEISKVISFQSRHQRKLLTHYKKRPCRFHTTRQHPSCDNSQQLAGAISSRLSSQNMLGSHSSQSPSVSRFQGAPLTPELTFNLSSKWESPIFKSSSSFRGSMSSLVSPSP
ncbi:putative E3 SUMO-protein ligase RNF212 [Oryzias melastigma]|uniref:Putative E3 SUMO-protein ligase RNF212 n=1 Tax=Oryzias melastigma TaxID=30732 RepID=A0A834BS70_ORYME|nr:putative E3 SUMO-protein ligase RNF212 [Oryzias melastigma]